MKKARIALLEGRGVVSVTGEDARGFLDNLITNDMDLLDSQPAIHAGLLSPQGKILFAFFVVRTPDGYLLETNAAQVPDLIKRLAMYRLRAKVVLNDLTASRRVIVAWDGEPPSSPLYQSFPDPRHPDLGNRLIMAPDMAIKLAAEDEGEARWHRHRIRTGVPEAEADYAIGDTFPHEADFDRFGGVSFTKGCFVGQEVVARMQHKTVVRKRVVRIAGGAPLVTGDTIKVGEATIGSVGSTDGSEALALLRLDRAQEAAEKRQDIEAGGTVVRVDAEALSNYAKAKEARGS